MRSVAVSKAGNRLYICPICGSKNIWEYIGTMWRRQDGSYKCISCHKYVIPLATPQEVR